MKNILCFIAMELLSLCSLAQPPLLKKGERLPPHEFTVRIGDSLYKKDLQDYQDKYLIIDFWGRHCIDCLASMPKMLRLQNEFKNKLAILLVTANTAAEIQTLFSKFSKKDGPAEWLTAAKQLPIITDDSFFSNLFPYKGLPAHVWIKDSLRYYSMAYSTSADSQTITSWVSGKNVKLDELVNRDIDPQNIASLLQANSESRNKSESYSLLLNRIEYGMGGGSWVNMLTDSLTNKKIGITCLNSSLPELYKIAYREKMNMGYIIPEDRIVWNISKKYDLTPPSMNSETFEKSSYYSWAQENTFCYSLKINPSLKQDLYSVMQHDLDRWFGLESSVRKVKVKCRIIKLINNKIPYLSSNIDSTKYLLSDQELTVENLPFEQLYFAIQKIANDQQWQTPLINELPNEGTMSYQIKSKKGLSRITLTDLNNQLKKYGAVIVEDYRFLNTLFIIDPSQ